MRVPLPTDFVARLSNASKDARMVNSLKETKVDGTQIKKRPGLTATGYNYSGLQGVLGLGGFLYLTYDDKFELSAYAGTPLPPYIYIGDLVGGYYAMIDNPPTYPGPDDPYWSSVAPGPDRYRTMLYYDTINGCNLSYPDHITGDVAASKDAAAKVFVEKVTSKLSPGLIVLWGYVESDNWVCDSISYPSDPLAYTWVEGSVDYVYQDIASRSDYIDVGTPLSDYPPSWPSGCGVWTGLFSHNFPVGVIGKKSVTTSFTVESVGTLGKVTAASVSYPLSTVIEISGCDQEAYNGTFNAIKSFDGDGYWYITLPFDPGTTTATGAKTLTYWYQF